MIFNFIWKIWLRLNLLTKDIDNDYIASVSVAGKKALRNADIARMIKDAGSELQYETLLYVLDQSDRIIRGQLQRGHSVQTGYCHITPKVTGAWTGANAKFNPAVHKVTLDFVPSAEMRAALKEVGIEVIGIKDSGAFIGLVTDTSTGLADGTVTSGDDILIEGDKLKISPDGEDGLGVFFINTNDKTVTPVVRRLTQNRPKKILARVPELSAGEYVLRIVTRYSNGTTLMKAPRIIDCDRPLVVN